MKAYIATSFSNRLNDESIINCIVHTLDNLQIQPLVFVDTYSFSATQEKEMMVAAMKAIDDCEILIANGSHKAVGVGIEAGYAKAKGKLVTYVQTCLLIQQLYPASVINKLCMKVWMTWHCCCSMLCKT